MRHNKIEVFTFITRNSADYAEQLQSSMEMLKSGRYQIYYRCIESINADRLPKGWDCVGTIKEDYGHNCLNHAIAMHKALQHVKAGTVLFVDADMVMLHKDWDNILFIETNRHKVWGTAFGDDSLQYHRFPNVFLFGFKRSYSEMVEMDFSPKLKKGVESPVRYKITDAKEAKAFNKDIGDTIKCDTGWGLPLQAYKMGIKGGYMPRVLGGQLPYKNEEQKAFCMTKPEHQAEWHYKGKLYCTHLQASRNHGIKSKWGKIWKWRINAYLKKEYGVKI